MAGSSPAMESRENAHAAFDARSAKPASNAAISCPGLAALNRKR